MPFTWERAQGPPAASPYASCPASRAAFLWGPRVRVIKAHSALPASGHPGFPPRRAPHARRRCSGVSVSSTAACACPSPGGVLVAEPPPAKSFPPADPVTDPLPLSSPPRGEQRVAPWDASLGTKVNSGSRFYTTVCPLPEILSPLSSRGPRRVCCGLPSSPVSVPAIVVPPRREALRQRPPVLPKVSCPSRCLPGPPPPPSRAHVCEGEQPGSSPVCHGP